MSPNDLLHFTLSALKDTYHLYPVLGAELECYVVINHIYEKEIYAFWHAIYESAINHKIPLLRIEKERGEHQYELVLGIRDDPQQYAESISILRRLVEQEASRQHYPCSFSGKPFADASSSGLHLHLHFSNEKGENQMHKTDKYISPTLAHAISGICRLTPYVMPILYPTETSYARLDEKDHVARFANWGSNNRSCAVRIPYTQAWDDKRIEWRVPCAEADAEKTIALMLFGAFTGLKHALGVSPQTYGLSDKEGNGECLPNTLMQALDKMDSLDTIFSPLSPDHLRDWI